MNLKRIENFFSPICKKISMCLYKGTREAENPTDQIFEKN